MRLSAQVRGNLPAVSVGMCFVLFVALSVAATELIVRVVKETATRPRPPAIDAADHASGFSFPSGHASASLALFGSLALLLSHRLPIRLQVSIWSAVSALIIAIGATRVYLGVHYPTDVAAGWLLAAATSIGTWTVLLRRYPLRFSLPDVGARLRIGYRS